MGRSPKTLQVVVGALTRQKDVSHHRIEVEARPGPFLQPSARQRMGSGPARQIGHLPGNSPHLAIGIPLADHEVIRDGGPPTKVDPDHGAGPAG